MNIQTNNFNNKTRTLKKAEPQTQQVDRSAYDASEEAWDNYTAESRELSAGSNRRGTIIGVSTIVGLSALGGYVGSLTGTAGAVAGAIVGAGGGLTVGGLSGLYLGRDEGFSALGYMALGAAATAVAGGFAGHSFGSQSLPIIGAIAGGVAGIAAGYGLSIAVEDKLQTNLKVKYDI